MHWALCLAVRVPELTLGRSLCNDVVTMSMIQKDLHVMLSFLQVKWSDYAPIMVGTIPFYLRAEPGHPVLPSIRSMHPSPWF